MLLQPTTSSERALLLTPPAQRDTPPSVQPSTGENEDKGPQANTFVANTTSKNDFFQVSITTQPPPKTVYQRILKPFPTVTFTVAPKSNSTQNKHQRSRNNPLSDDEEDDQQAKNTAEAHESYAQVLETLSANGTSNSSHNGLFVEATLLRGDNGEPLSKCLDGNSIVRFEKNPWAEGVYTATFKKLKILSTSQQLQGILFRLKFTLKRYDASQFINVDTPDCEVVSHPIEVFSHSQYLNRKAPKFSTGASASPSAGVRKEIKDIVKGMDSKKVQSTLFGVLQAFKEQGGSRAAALEAVQQVFGGSEPDVNAAGSSLRRMSAPPSAPSYVAQAVLAPTSMTLAPLPTADVGNAPASAAEINFINELLAKLQFGAISFDEMVSYLGQAVGQPRTSQLLAQMGLTPIGDAVSAAPAPALAPVPAPAPAPLLPPLGTGAFLDATTNPMAAILSALAHQQSQLAQLQAAHQQSQLGLLPQLHVGQQQAPPVVPKPRRLSDSLAGLPMPTVVAPASASSSLCTLADAISSHVNMQQLPPQTTLAAPSSTTLTSSSVSSSSASSSSSPLLPPLLSALGDSNRCSFPSSMPSSAAASSVLLPPISAGNGAAPSNNSSGPLPSLFSLCSLASVIDSTASSTSTLDATQSGRKRSFEAAVAASTAAVAATAPTDGLPSPAKVARRDAPEPLPTSSLGNDEASKPVQWYWKNNATWEPYAESVSTQLERAHKSQTPCVVVLHDVTYMMDFHSMTQKRIDNPKRWKHIRRGED